MAVIVFLASTKCFSGETVASAIMQLQQKLRKSDKNARYAHLHEKPYASHPVIKKKNTNKTHKKTQTKTLNPNEY